jgi:hypothetical protein
VDPAQQQRLIDHMQTCQALNGLVDCPPGQFRQDQAWRALMDQCRLAASGDDGDGTNFMTMKF